MAALATTGVIGFCMRDHVTRHTSYEWLRKNLPADRIEGAEVVSARRAGCDEFGGVHDRAPDVVGSVDHRLAVEETAKAVFR